MKACQEHAQHRDSRLALARLAHSLASNLQASFTFEYALQAFQAVMWGDATCLRLQLSMVSIIAVGDIQGEEETAAVKPVY